MVQNHGLAKAADSGTPMHIVSGFSSEFEGLPNLNYFANAHDSGEVSTEKITVALTYSPQ